MMEDHLALAALIEARQADYTAMSDRIWDLAEPRFREVQSAALQQAYLESCGFAVKTGLAGMETAFSASFGIGGPVVAFLGEYDALPGMSQAADEVSPTPGKTDCCHGCGHNLLGVGALAAAVALKEYMEREHLPGTVRYYGCPAEENAGAKAFLVREGCFDDCDAALSWHPAAMTAVQPSGYLANFRVFFTFRGKAAHAASAPHLGRSALDAVELMNVGVNYLREHIISDARVHYAITDAGGATPNVVPAHAQVLYAIRAPRVEDVESIYQRVCDVARGAALMTGTAVEIRRVAAYADFVANPVVSDALDRALEKLLPIELTDEERACAAAFHATMTEAELAEQQKQLRICLGDRAARRLAEEPFLGQYFPMPAVPLHSYSTDLGNVSWVVPTGQIDAAVWAAGTAAHSWQAAAVGRSAMAHKGMLLAAKALAAAGCEFLRRPEMAQAAQAALAEADGGPQWKTLLPESVEPKPW